MNYNNYNGNGRIQFLDTIPQYDTETQQSVNYGIQGSALNGIQEQSALSRAFFGADNINRLQREIIRGVYNQSGGKYKIGNQSNTELGLIMRATYLQNARNLTTNIHKQISELNRLVVEYSVRKIIPAVELYYYYLKDAGNNPVPLAHSVNTSVTGTRSLEFKKFF
jgi:hypothetical protein